MLKIQFASDEFVTISPAVKGLCFSSLDYIKVQAKIPWLWNKALGSLQTQKLVTHAQLFLIFRKYTFSDIRFSYKRTLLFSQYTCVIPWEEQLPLIHQTVH